MEMWKKISSERVYDGWRKVDKVTFEMPDESSCGFDIYEEGEAVCVFAITESGEVIMAKQFRPGTCAVYDELPGGALEAGEDLQEAVKRELLEETGYEVGELHKTISFPLSGYSTCIRHAFLATDCQKVSEQKLDDTEFVEVVLKSQHEFEKQLWDGNLTDVAAGFAGLQKLKNLKESK